MVRIHDEWYDDDDDYWLDDDLVDDDCEHDWETKTCDRCGGYQGMVCNHCGAWSDGGDHMAAQDDIWCRCRE